MGRLLRLRQVLLCWCGLRLAHAELAHRRAGLHHRDLFAVPAQVEGLHRAPVRMDLRVAHGRRADALDAVGIVAARAQAGAELFVGELLVALLLGAERDLARPLRGCLRVTGPQLGRQFGQLTTLP